MNHSFILDFLKKSIVICFLLTIISCSKTGDTTSIVNPNDTTKVYKDPAQYGTPFTGVSAPLDATIYQVNMRSFSSQSSLQGVTDRLDSIKALGVNVIYLMPIYPVGTVNSVNSPYCVKDYKSINYEFGSLIDLRALVDGAHTRNMSVILDWVGNHTAWDHIWMSTPTWYLQDGNGKVLSPPGTGWNDVAQLNFNNSDMRIAMIRAMKYWVFTANVDGFRCDYADGPPVDFWKQAIDSLRNITTHKLLMLAEGTRSANYAAGFDFNFGFNFYGLLKNIYSNNQSITSIDGLNISEYTGSTANNQIVRYITNHDVNSSDGTPLTLFGGKAGSMAAFVVVAYMKSVPMIYNGQEVGTPYRLTFPFTSTKIDWTLNRDITAEYKKVIAFRNTSVAIRKGAMVSYNTSDLCVFTKTLGTEKVLVISNLRNKVVNYTVSSDFANTTWNDVINGGTITLSNQLTLQPYSYMVLKL